MGLSVAEHGKALNKNNCYCSLVVPALVRSLKFKFLFLTVFSDPEGCLWTAYPEQFLKF